MNFKHNTFLIFRCLRASLIALEKDDSKQNLARRHVQQKK